MKRWRTPVLQATTVEMPPGQGVEVSGPGVEEKVADQALAQEQAVFERKIRESGALFKLQLAMGWMTFVIVPASVVAVILYPPAAVGAVPLNGLAVWNWRRMLKRGSGEIEVTTKHPGSNE